MSARKMEAIDAALTMRQWVKRSRDAMGREPTPEEATAKLQKVWPALSDNDRAYAYEHGYLNVRRFES